MKPSDFERLLEISQTAFQQRYFDRLISFSNVHEKGTDVLCRSRNWKGVDLRAPLLEALSGVQQTGDTQDPDEQEAWRGALARGLYTPSHRMSDEIQMEALACHRIKMDWMRAVEMQPAWEAGADAETLTGIYTPSPALEPGLLETLELAVMQGPLRTASKDKDWKVFWAASALQQQRLHVFEALEPDAALMAKIVSTTRPVRDPDLHREHPFNRKAYLYDSNWGDLKEWKECAQRLANDPSNTRVLSWLWLEWLHDPAIHLGTHRLAQRFGVDLSARYSDGSCWISAVASPDVLEGLLVDYDPMAPTHPWKERLLTFVSFGPACTAWRQENPDVWRNQWPENRPWILDYLHNRWRQWTSQEQHLALAAWKIQALTGWGPQGIRAATASVSFTNTKAGWVAFDMDDVTQWAANKRGEKKDAGGWRHPILLEVSPVPQWIHPDGTQESFAAGYFRTALHAPAESMRLPADSAWLSLRTPSPDEDALRLLFSLGHAPMARECLTLSQANGCTGELLAGVAREILENVVYPNCDVMVDCAVSALLQAWLRRENLLPQAAWDGFTPHACGLAAQLLDRKRLSLLLLLEWAAQGIPPEQALFVSHTLLRMMADTSNMSSKYRGEDHMEQVIDALVNTWSQLAVDDGDFPEGAGVHRQLWRQAVSAWPALEMAQVRWRQRQLEESLPGTHIPTEAKPRL